MTPKDYSQMMAYLTRPAMADGGRIGFKKGERADLLFDNLTRIENAKRMGVTTKNAMGFINHPDHPNKTYTDYRNKKTGEIIRKYGVRVRRQNLKKKSSWHNITK